MEKQNNKSIKEIIDCTMLNFMKFATMILQTKNRKLEK